MDEKGKIKVRGCEREEMNVELAAGSCVNTSEEVKRN
jgi:hypothetical protein